MRIHASTNQEWEELEAIVAAMNTFLRAALDATEEELAPAQRGPALTVLEGSRRSTKSSRRKRPALTVVR